MWKILEGEEHAAPKNIWASKKIVAPVGNTHLGAMMLCSIVCW